MKKKLTIILLSMVVAVTMLAPLQAFAQDTAAVAGQQSEQADSQEETSAPAQTQETAQKYTVKFRAADARGHLLKGAAFRVSAQNGGGADHLGFTETHLRNLRRDRNQSADRL